jgi:Protein of unknown function (DUF2914)
MEAYRNVLAWAQQNERHLGALVFVLGFVIDIFTFGELGLSWVSLIFLLYLAIAVVTILTTHYYYSRNLVDETTTQKSLRVLSPLAAQFFIGSLLSGTLIFYTRSATFFVSWPFLLLLVIIFFGNEYYRKYKERLIFQTIQFFVALYAYTLFAYPFYTHTLTNTTFLYSTVISVSVMFVFLLTLFFVGKQRFLKSFRRVVISCLALTLALVGSYYSGVLPPLPLSLKDVGVYHSVTHTGTQYVIQKESSTLWYAFWKVQTVHLRPGDSLYGYSAVFAPGAFTANLMHTWEKYDGVQKKWVQKSKVAFTLSGGRDDGYRGYSYITAPESGLWRLSVLSESEQVLGRVQFQVENVDTEPVLESVTK